MKGRWEGGSPGASEVSKRHSRQRIPCCRECKLCLPACQCVGIPAAQSEDVRAGALEVDAGHEEPPKEV